MPIPMTTHETDTPLTAEIERMRQRAARHQARALRIIAALLVAAVAIGTAVWFFPRPIDRDELHLQLALGLGAATFCLGCIVARVAFPRPTAECPRCGCNWNVASGNDVHRWLAWQNCPECGLEMGRDNLLPKRPG